jgi:hypothetical protein
LSFILVLYIYAGTFAKGDSVTLTNIPGFSTEKACQVAGELAKSNLVTGSSKELRFICIKNQ